MLFLWVLLFTAASLVSSQAIDDSSLPACGQTCINNLVAQAADLGCPGGAAPCMCTKPNFYNGVHDCAQAACAADLFATVTSFMDTLCGATVAPSAAATSTPPTTAPGTTAPAPSTAPTTSSVATTSAEVTSLTSSPTDTATTAASTTSLLSSSTSAPLTTTSDSTSSAPTTSATSTTSDASSSTAALGSAPTASVTPSDSSSDSNNAPAATPAASPSNGLSTGAKVGVAVGCAAGAVSLGALLAYVIVSRRRKNNGVRIPSRSMNISDPMTGSGRSYASSAPPSRGYEMGMSELEMRSRRYEDMVPRATPRTMV